MNDVWQQVGTVEILRFRIYPIDPTSDPFEQCTEVAVEPGVFPVYRRYDAIQWIMRGRINDRTPKIGDGLFVMNSADAPTGLEVQFPSRAYGIDQFADFLTDPVCRPGPDHRLEFDVDIPELSDAKRGVW